MAVNINVPSQVKTYANLAAFPASGALKTIYIAEDTNKTYRWTGSVYVEVSAAGASGITIGTTAIASGTVGRVLFEGTGNVVQESANLFWDDTNGRLGIGTSSPQARYSQSQTQGILAHYGITNANANQNRGVWEFYTNTAVTPDFFGRFGFKFEGGVNNTSRQFQLHVGDNTTPRFVVNGSGNVLIGTITDAGYRLDVNGTARVISALTSDTDIFRVTNGSSVNVLRVKANGNFTMGGSSDLGIGSGLGVFMRYSLRVGSLSYANTSAILQADSTTRGFLKPRLTTTQKNAIASPDAGLEVYDTTLNRPCFYDGTTWITL